METESTIFPATSSTPTIPIPTPTPTTPTSHQQHHNKKGVERVHDVFRKFKDSDRPYLVCAVAYRVKPENQEEEDRLLGNQDGNPFRRLTGDEFAVCPICTVNGENEAEQVISKVFQEADAAGFSYRDGDFDVLTIPFGRFSLLPALPSDSFDVFYQDRDLQSYMDQVSRKFMQREEDLLARINQEFGQIREKDPNAVIRKGEIIGQDGLNRNQKVFQINNQASDGKFISAPGGVTIEEIKTSGE